MLGRGFAQQRLSMVKTQLQQRGVDKPSVLQAFLKVQRHLFVPTKSRSAAYRDQPQPIGCGQTISQPYMVAVMVQEAAIAAEHKVLEIGTGCGYQTAILAELGGAVYSVERVPELIRRAKALLHHLGYTQVHFHQGDGTLGWPNPLTFDAIVVSAGAPRVPPALIEQLAPQGRLVIPIQEGRFQALHIITRTARGLETRRGEGCRFVPLVGRYGWEEES